MSVKQRASTSPAINYWWKKRQILVIYMYSKLFFIYVEQEKYRQIDGLSNHTKPKIHVWHILKLKTHSCLWHYDSWFTIQCSVSQNMKFILLRSLYVFVILNLLCVVIFSNLCILVCFKIVINIKKKQN